MRNKVNKRGIDSYVYAFLSAWMSKTTNIYLARHRQGAEPLYDICRVHRTYRVIHIYDEADLERKHMDIDRHAPTGGEKYPNNNLLLEWI